MTDIAASRLRAQRLTGPACPSAVDVVRWLGAVQAQDYGGAKWALGQRTDRTTDAQIDRLYDEGAILRTHVMRPTWHFVLPEDIRGLLELTTPRLRAGLAGRRRQLGIGEGLIARAHGAFGAALGGGRSLTRTELGEVLTAAGIAAVGQRLPHLLMTAELDGLIVSGPRRGKQFTYALLEERAPKAGARDRTAALRELTRRYFRSHGPAQVQDFVWWSGLTAADGRAGIALAGAELEQEVIEGKIYWLDPGAGTARQARSIAHLLPNFDEYTVAYRDRAAAVHPDRRFDRSNFSLGSILANVVALDGHVVGTWRRRLVGDVARVGVQVLGSLSPAEVGAVQYAGQRLARFLERPVKLAWG